MKDYGKVEKAIYVGGEKDCRNHVFKVVRHKLCG